MHKDILNLQEADTSQLRTTDTDQSLTLLTISTRNMHIDCDVEKSFQELLVRVMYT